MCYCAAIWFFLQFSGMWHNIQCFTVTPWSNCRAEMEAIYFCETLVTIHHLNIYNHKNLNLKNPISDWASKMFEWLDSIMKTISAPALLQFDKNLTGISLCLVLSHAGDRSASSTTFVSRTHSKLRHAQLSRWQERISYMLITLVTTASSGPIWCSLNYLSYTLKTVSHKIPSL